MATSISSKRRHTEAGSAHEWLRRNFPKVNRCERCGAEGRTDYAFRRHPEAHTRKREDYLELCKSCHKRMDTNTVGMNLVHVNAFVPADLGQEVRRLARVNDRSLSAEIRRALAAYVERDDETEEDR